MERKVYERMISWKGNPDRKALLIRGPRQVGKTFVIKEFAKRNYDNIIYVDLEDRADLLTVFESENLSAEEILKRLSFDSGVRLTPGRTVIVLDEIQACIPAYSALKSLVVHGGFDIVASGSLLGAKIDDLQRRTPMGYVDVIDMLSMDFEEFLWAIGVEKDVTGYLRDCIQNRERIDDFICKRVSGMFREYMVVGGMPAAVSAYDGSRDYQAAKVVLDDLIEHVEEDAERYSKGAQRLRIAACFHSVPQQLSDESSKFTYYRIEKRKGGVRMYESALLWLQKAGLIEYCHNLEEMVAPLNNRTCPNSFKIYMSDTGILTAMLEGGTAGTIVNRDPYANNGAVMENAVACALKRNGYMLRYFKKPNSTLEIDFVINMGGEVSAIDIKSGRNRKSKSLRTVQKDRSVARAIKISDGNVMVDENGTEHYPLFGPCFFRESDGFDVTAAVDTEEVNRRFETMGKGL